MCGYAVRLVDNSNNNNNDNDKNKNSAGCVVNDDGDGDSEGQARILQGKRVACRWRMRNDKRRVLSAQK